ncbi:hypothetical protein MTO96_039996 [Rhipicephalus appendiculatus]
MSSIVSQVMAHSDRVFGHLLDHLTTHTWLTLDDLNVFSQNHGPLGPLLAPILVSILGFALSLLQLPLLQGQAPFFELQPPVLLTCSPFTRFCL